MSSARRHGILGRVTSGLLIALLASGGPGLGMAWASEPQPDPSMGALAVGSDPVGAQVFVDGELAGQTPLQLGHVAPGDHRVRVVKQGYLENSRVVHLGAGNTHNVDVKLTPHTGARAAAPLQVEESSGGGGGGKTKWILIGLGVVGAGAAVYFLTKNDPPTPGTITVTPNATGMAGITNFSFSSNASDPDKDPLTFNWNFGDGGSGSGQAPSHVYNNTGSFSVGVSISDGKGHTVSAPNASVTVARSMSGNWSGARESGFGANVGVTLSQSGTNLTGSTIFSGAISGTLPGLTGSVSTLSYPCNVTFQTGSFRVNGLPGTFNITFSGTVDASGNRMSGTITSTSTALQPPTVSNSTTFTR